MKTANAATRVQARARGQLARARIATDAAEAAAAAVVAAEADAHAAQVEVDAAILLQAHTRSKLQRERTRADVAAIELETKAANAGVDAATRVQAHARAKLARARATAEAARVAAAAEAQAAAAVVEAATRVQAHARGKFTRGHRETGTSMKRPLPEELPAEKAPVVADHRRSNTRIACPGPTISNQQSSHACKLELWDSIASEAAEAELAALNFFGNFDKEKNEYVNVESTAIARADEMRPRRLGRIEDCKPHADTFFPAVDLADTSVLKPPDWLTTAWAEAEKEEQMEEAAMAVEKAHVSVIYSELEPSVMSVSHAVHLGLSAAREIVCDAEKVEHELEKFGSLVDQLDMSQGKKVQRAYTNNGVAKTSGGTRFPHLMQGPQQTSKGSILMRHNLSLDWSSYRRGIGQSATRGDMAGRAPIMKPPDRIESNLPPLNSARKLRHGRHDLSPLDDTSLATLLLHARSSHDTAASHSLVQTIDSRANVHQHRTEIPDDIMIDRTVFRDFAAATAFRVEDLPSALQSNPYTLSQHKHTHGKRTHGAVASERRQPSGQKKGVRSLHLPSLSN